MTDQHPLTDRICFNILSNKYDVSGSDWHKYQNTVDLMRAAADWQLAEVIEFLEANKDLSVETALRFIRPALRPQQQEGNN